jgi:hypothetical protein
VPRCRNRGSPDELRPLLEVCSKANSPILGHFIATVAKCRAREVWRMPARSACGVSASPSADTMGEGRGNHSAAALSCDGLNATLRSVIRPTRSVPTRRRAAADNPNGTDRVGAASAVPRPSGFVLALARRRRFSLQMLLAQQCRPDRVGFHRHAMVIAVAQPPRCPGLPGSDRPALHHPRPRRRHNSRVGRDPGIAVQHPPRLRI